MKARKRLSPVSNYYGIDYDVGKKAGNVAKDKSVYVYIYRKTLETIEDAPDDV